MTRSELVAEIRRLEWEIDGEEARQDSDALLSSRWPEVQAETDRRIDERSREISGTDAKLNILRDQLAAMDADRRAAAERAHAEVMEKILRAMDELDRGVGLS